ncbi:hypothetical protein H4R33_000651 [Dimargaris cristalligena]|uniref:Uncharacterized protein n=1 Tax=Dimargaris cristalligena TaxID=215637 RepID=A0A4Q0A2Q6_9FUNG|nr:hypothetical protein H4R33_000651 [Dimargaris cristalligena]RKP39811.1 hypothetical protein BJ085DRAFT_30974 [Dimargaris cristalligena]|eukprot:RKP39811.1 hypothetical protein BJ085DRAFT_30974 [Dimargaris cristalligena]
MQPRYSPFKSLIVVIAMVSLGQSTVVHNPLNVQRSYSDGATQFHSNAYDNTETLEPDSSISPCLDLRRILPLVKQLCESFRSGYESNMDDGDKELIYESYFRILGSSFRAYLMVESGHSSEIIQYPYQAALPDLAESHPLYACMQEEPELAIDVLKQGASLVSLIGTDAHLAQILQRVQLAQSQSRWSRALTRAKRLMRKSGSQNEEVDLVNDSQMAYVYPDFPADNLVERALWYFSVVLTEVQAVAQAQGNSKARELAMDMQHQWQGGLYGYYASSDDEDIDDDNTSYFPDPMAKHQSTGRTKRLMLAFTKADATYFFGPTLKRWARKRWPLNILSKGAHIA